MPVKYPCSGKGPVAIPVEHWRRPGRRARQRGSFNPPMTAILGPMKLYFAGPLFSAAERAWNAEIVADLRAAGHEVFLPQEKEAGLDAARIFADDVRGIDWAAALVAIMDGPDPDSGTAWECGYAYGKKPIILVRTDIRAEAGSSRYNAMLTGSATDRLDLPGAAKPEIIRAVLQAVANVERTSLQRGSSS